MDSFFEKNSNKILLGSVILAIGSTVILAAAFILFTAIPGERVGLCDYPSPRPILTTVPGADGPAVMERGQIVERATRCVSGASFLNVLAFRDFLEVEPGGCTTRTGVKRTVRDLQGQAQVRIKGSTVSDTTVQLPPDVTPGNWCMIGSDVVSSTGEFRVWWSQEFTVLRH